MMSSKKRIKVLEYSIERMRALKVELLGQVRQLDRKIKRFKEELKNE